MPLYEYQCKKCGNHIEVLQKFTDRPKRRCPECSGKLEKLISRTSFQLKGGGWCAQGYSGGKASDSSSSTSGTSSSSSDSSTKSDSGSGSKASAATA